MNLHSLPKIVDKPKKRRGRGYGSGAGAKSGKGTTRHQKARENIPLHFEGGQNKMTKRYPLLRGKGRNKSIREQAVSVNISKLEKFAANTRVDLAALLEAKLVSVDAVTRGVKILGRGALTKALEVAVPTSKKAGEKIEKIGGKLITS
ncbi:50S ribosomal protein L15 [Candidatus Woesebacteria bacterium]|jgi:large subunit ribosomal protein L15|nr:50S ribosomal protein L15 [Candidatus Woesebacteria bacterium]